MGNDGKKEEKRGNRGNGEKEGGGGKPISGAFVLQVTTVDDLVSVLLEASMEFPCQALLPEERKMGHYPFLLISHQSTLFLRYY